MVVSKQVGHFQSNPPSHIWELGFLVNKVTQHTLCDQIFTLDGLSAKVDGREKAKKEFRIRHDAATVVFQIFHGYPLWCCRNLTVGKLFAQYTKYVSLFLDLLITSSRPKTTEHLNSHTKKKRHRNVFTRSLICISRDSGH